MLAPEIDTGPVVFNVAGQGTNQPINLAGNSFSNPTFDPRNFQMIYAGTSPITVTGGSEAAAMIYAPNSAITLSGGSHFYGSILGAQVVDTGGTAFHYDRSLQDEYFIVGNYMMSSFTWKKY